MTESRGTCQLCRKVLSKRTMLDHLASCVGQPEASGPQALIQLRIEGANAPAYWLDVDVKAGAKLESLDQFLREIWLECCGHLSSFTIGKSRYSSMLDDFDRDPSEKTLQNEIERVIGRRKTPFEYEYDFGSTTNLILAVTARATGPTRRDAVRLLARNDQPALSCQRRGCSAPATSICAYCVWEGGALACDKHARRHTCGEAEGWLPVVNSPRMGVCAYTGPDA